MPTTESEKSAEDEALDVLLSGEPPPAAAPKPRYDHSEEVGKTNKDEQKETISSRPRPWSAPAPTESKPPEPARRRSGARDTGRSRFSGFALSPTIIMGLVMMTGSAVWFFGGLALGILFIYPPILFVLGVLAFIRGCMGQED